MINILNVVNGNNYISLGREMMRVIGIHESIFLYEIIDKYQFFLSQGSLEDGWFYLKIETIEERTCLTRKQQDSCIENLIRHGLIEKKVMGCPPKRYFKFNQQKLLEMCGVQIIKENTTNLYQSDKLNCTNGTNRIVPIGQIPIYIRTPKKNSKEKREKQASHFSLFSDQEWIDFLSFLKSKEISEERGRCVIEHCLKDTFWIRKMNNIKSVIKNFDTMNIQTPPSFDEMTEIEKIEHTIKKIHSKYPESKKCLKMDKESLCVNESCYNRKYDFSLGWNEINRRILELYK